mgnify:CR=1 FL=1
MTTHMKGAYHESEPKDRRWQELDKSDSPWIDWHNTSRHSIEARESHPERWTGTRRC